MLNLIFAIVFSSGNSLIMKFAEARTRNKVSLLLVNYVVAVLFGITLIAGSISAAGEAGAPELGRVPVLALINGAWCVQLPVDQISRQGDLRCAGIHGVHHIRPRRGGVYQCGECGCFAREAWQTRLHRNGSVCGGDSASESIAEKGSRCEMKVKKYTSQPGLLGVTLYFDACGSKVGEGRPKGMLDVIEYFDAHGNKKGHSEVDVLGQRIYYDSRGQKIGRSAIGLMGTVQYYDNHGSLVGESEPTLLGGSTYYEVK